MDIPTLSGDKIPLNLANEVIRPTTVKRIPGTNTHPGIIKPNNDNNDMIIIMAGVQVTGCPCRRSRVRREISSSPLISSFRRSCLRTPRTCCTTSCQTKHSVHLLMSSYVISWHYVMMSFLGQVLLL